MLPTTAIVLAAGLGTRLGDRTRETPKPLIPVHGIPLLRRMTDELVALGVDRLVVVVGHLGEVLTETVQSWSVPVALEFVVAEDYATTNNSMSLLAAADALAGGAWIVEGDVLVAPGSLAAAFDEPVVAGGAWVTAPFLERYDGCCLRSDGDGRIVDLSIRRRPFTGPPPGTHKSVGVVMVGPELAPRLIEALRAFRARGETGVYYDLVLRTLFAEVPVVARSIGERFWIEIDDGDDLARAEREFDAGPGA